MYRVLVLFHVVSQVVSIIVTDPPLKPTDYKYSYDIYDPLTGDHKTQREIRLGDVVKGAYTVLDPDGNKRTVEYTADAKHGFKAVVLAEPTNTIVPANPAPIQEASEAPQAYGNVYYNNPIQAQSEGYRTNVVSIPYIKSKYITDQYNQYFTPVNEIRGESARPISGHYFLPATK